MEKYYITEKSGRRRSASYVACEGCGEKFLKSNIAIKNTKKHYCKPECLIKPKKEYTCHYCKKTFERKSTYKKSKSGLYFCCVKCKDEATKLENNVTEIWPEHYGNISKSNYREKALNEYPNECAECGYKEHPEILEVHHIDGDRENNDIKNLIILCPNHHSMLTLKLAILTEDRKIIIKKSS